MLKREAYKFLKKWKEKASRKPLIIRGARQVGKTTLVKEFSKTYKKKILLNLEKEKDASYFSDFPDVHKIVEALFLENNLSIRETEHTLLFIDEIQESSRAIELLRYFYEEIPELHIIAAGSLLEFVMGDVKSFPVGRVEFLYLHPLNFEEFLIAQTQDIALNYLREIPVDNVAHNKLLSEFHTYAIIGGMPEIVSAYSKFNSITELPEIYESIWSTYLEDVGKYGTGATEKRVIRHIFGTAHLYIDQRIKFQNFGESNYKSREVGEAFRQLDKANIIKLIYPVTKAEPPLVPDLKKAPRLQILDTGLANYTLGIQAELLSMSDLSGAFRGAIIPHLVTQQIISKNVYKYFTPHFWVREKAQANSEVDMVLQYKAMVIPVEIKSGSVGKMRSLHQFMSRCGHQFAVRLSANYFNIEEVSSPYGENYFLMNLPYYLATCLDDYIEYFVETYKNKKPAGE